MFYGLIRPLLFQFDPETIHDLLLSGLSFLGRRKGLLHLADRLSRPDDPRLKLSCFGLDLDHPIGLAAGFDKNAVAIPVWPFVGFAFAEVGTLTRLEQPGNPRPRLLRYPEDEAIINRMGFNNRGAEAIAARLARLEAFGWRRRIPLGINIGKSKAAPLEEAAEDYLESLTHLWDFADYFVVNVSSPNTPGLRMLQARDRLEALLGTLLDYARARSEAEARPKRILLKIAPDLDAHALDDITELALEKGIDGLIATNTTLSREGLSAPVREEGGLSGRPLAAKSLAVLRHLRARVGDRIPLVASGGIFSGRDVYLRIRAGARLVQVYTALVYRGPSTVHRMKRELLACLEADGLGRIEQAVGLDAVSLAR